MLGASPYEVPPEVAGGVEVRGAGSAVQYAKTALLVDAEFRKYNTILYLDADGQVRATLKPLMVSPLPAGGITTQVPGTTTHWRHVASRVCIFFSRISIQWGLEKSADQIYFFPN